MHNHKILIFIIIALLAKTILDPIAGILAANPGVAALLLLLAAAILALACFTLGILFTHLKFARMASRK